MTDSANVHDDVVYSNAFYALAAFGAWGHSIAFGVTLAAGLLLAGASGVYHATYERWSQRLDVWAMMTYLAALVSVLAGDWHAGFYGILPVASVLYGLYTWEINSFVHVPIWVGIGLVLVAARSGAWALVPATFFLAGGTVKLGDFGSDSAQHSLWHLFGACAFGSALYFAL